MSPGPRNLVPALVLAAAVWAAACGPPQFVPGPFVPVEEADPADVVAVLFLAGDVGNARREDTPLVHQLRADVERWSARLPGDSSVAVVFLGDNVYPVGLRGRSHDDFPRDSARLHAQIWTVSGPEARADGVPGVFLAGNHDWGSMRGPEGVERLRIQQAYLEQVSLEGGPAVSLVPRAGASGPSVLELGGAAQVVLLDTQWWLQSESPEERGEMLARLAPALRTDDGRPVVVAAHHPYATGGRHAERGLLDPFGLLGRTGAIIQDLSAEPYRELREAVRDVFRETGPPLVYAAGHDHSLQVLEGAEPGAPRWNLVSGAGSKLSGVTDVPGMVWAETAPGYMRLLFRESGRVDLFVERTDPAYLRCDVEAQELAACLQAGMDAFTTGYSARLR